MKLSQSARLRSQSYGFLADIYNLLPNADFLTMIARAEARAMFTGATQTAPAVHGERQTMEAGLAKVEGFQSELPSTGQEGLLVRLGVDRTRLLRGVRRGYGPLPPYQSLYRGGQVLMGEAAVGARGFYSKYGYRPRAEGNEPPDYIGLELDFMRFLCDRGAKARRGRSRSEPVDWEGGQRDFLCNHVAAWVPAFCDQMLVHAKEDFFRGVAELTRAFVILDVEALQRPDRREL